MTLDAALEYTRRGWKVIPVPRGQKEPTIKNWPKLRLTENEIKQIFTKEVWNVGILLGAASNGLVDVDLDDPLAIRLARYFLPSTGAIFGRTSKPMSHWLYICKNAKTKKWKTNDGKMILELRTAGCQTIFPPSTHPSGEQVRWDEEGEPATVDLAELERACAKLAAATLLAKHWPPQGSRHEAALALAGGLVRLGWNEQDIELFIEATAWGAGDEEPRDRIKTVIYTARKNGASPTTGWKRLSEIIAPEVIQKILEWLGGEKAEKETKPHIKLLTAAELMATDFPEPTWLIPGVLPEGGLVLLAGRPKIGKSWLALEMACELSNGSAICGIQPEKAAKTLYLALEDTPRRLKARIQQAGLTPNENSLISTTWPKLNEEGIALLGKTIKQAGIQVVIIDTLAKVKPSSKAKAISLYDSDYEILGNLKDLADRLGTTIVVVHHLRKSAGDDPVEEVSGTTGITGAVDTVLVLKRARGEADGTLFITGRDVEEKELALRFDHGRWEVLGEAKLYELSKVRREILEAIEALGGSASPKEVAAATGRSYDSTKHLLRRLETEGLVISFDRGRYSTPTIEFTQPFTSFTSFTTFTTFTAFTI